jgi:citronellol/citronellal dehydrogenase
MTTNGTLAGKTILISGGSRGIGLAIAIRAAQDGANVAFIAKTDVPDPRIPGTIHSAAKEIEAAGGQVLPILGDIRDWDTVENAVTLTVDRFGSLDVLVNNASAIDLHRVGHLAPKRFNLLLDVNVRGTYQLITAALPHLTRSPGGHVMTLSPPLNPDPRWLSEHAPYTLTKFGMTMLTLGLARQHDGSDLAAYCLWPQTLIATAAVRNVVAGQDGMKAARTPEVMADAAYLLLTGDAAAVTGRCHIDADVLRAAGHDDLSAYAAVPGTADEDLALDLFI